MNRFLVQSVLIFSIITGSVFYVNGQIKPSKLFNSGMVLQRDVKIPVWGTSNAGDTIKVSLNSQSATAIAGKDGKWKAILPPMKAGGPFVMTLNSKKATLTFSDVYMGDVWMASGQSNMEWTLKNADSSAADIAAANDQKIREFKMNKNLSTEPLDTIGSGSWLPATAANVGNFSAVAYYFAKNLGEDLNIPIGILNTSYGGARIEAFMDDQMLGYDEKTVVLAHGEGERQPTLVYNSMIHPILQFPIKGILWYQGESNADNLEDAVSYGELFNKMITSWRAKWGLGNIPFLWAQLPNQGTKNVESNPSTWDAWPQLRAGQSRKLALPNTGEATTIDVGEVDIHPRNKKPVGIRMAIVARKVAYKENIVHSGPRYKSHRLLANGKVEISFDYVGSGLMKTVGDSLKWFSMAGSDGKLKQARARIKGDKVTVWNDQIPNPTIVRYAWEFNPIGVNFYNKEKLPATPFFIDLEKHSFGSGSFITTATTVERGSKAVLTWKIYGSSLVTLNGEKVDSLAASTVYPKTTTTYKLKSINASNPKSIDSLSLTVKVVDPKPTISLTTDQGGVAEPNKPIKIKAKANAPGGGTVAQVEFFINGVSIFTDLKSPFEADWLPNKMGDFTITAKVTDGNSNSTLSDLFSMTITTLKELKYEAEAVVSPSEFCEILPKNEASGGKYIFVKNGWKNLKFDVNVEQAGNYQLSIAYYLNSGDKTQGLKVNGIDYPNIVYQGSNDIPQKYKVNVALNAGSNTITIVESWGYMFFDYISIFVPEKK